VMDLLLAYYEQARHAHRAARLRPSAGVGGYARRLRRRRPRLPRRPVAGLRRRFHLRRRVHREPVEVVKKNARA
jgi:hypothetical protein